MEVVFVMERKKHIETIKRVKKFIKEKDYEGLKVFIDNREKEIKESEEKSKSSDYIESLVEELM